MNQNERREFSEKSKFSEHGVPGLAEECEEIIEFFDGVEDVKKKILNDKKNSTELKEKHSLTNDEIKGLLYKNVNLFNVISDDTVRIYIETIFEMDRVHGEIIYYKFTETSLDTFLTSILIFKQD
jgi:hypothetical protein